MTKNAIISTMPHRKAVTTARTVACGDRPRPKGTPARGAGEDRVEAARIALPIWSLARLAQVSRTRMRPRCGGRRKRMGATIEKRLFFVRREPSSNDGSFGWYVINGHTRRRASRTFKTRSAAGAQRTRLQIGA
jgi:hypothetical protein